MRKGLVLLGRSDVKVVGCELKPERNVGPWEEISKPAILELCPHELDFKSAGIHKQIKSMVLMKFL